MENPPGSLNSFTTILLPLRKELLDYLCVTQKYAQIISKWLHGFRDNKGIWHRSRLLSTSYKSDIWNETPTRTDSGIAKALWQLSNPVFQAQGASW